MKETRNNIYKKYFGEKDYEQQMDIEDDIEEFKIEYIRLKELQSMTDKEKRLMARAECLEQGVMRCKIYCK